MTLLALVLILAAALMHATWNSLIKLSGDGLVTTALMMGIGGLIGIPVAFFVPFPNLEVWLVLGVSGLVHVGYIFFLLRAYSHGDLSKVYPIARGTAPLLLALVAWIAIGEGLSNTGIVAIVLISGGIISLSYSNGRASHAERKAVLYAFATSMFIASYTFIDGFGARLAESPHSFVVWLFITQGIVFVGAALLFRRGAFLSLAKQERFRGAAGGVLSLAAYWIVVWALAAGAMAPVAALRETSVVFAAIIGAIFLKESFGIWRIVAAATVAAGVLLLQV
jgi:drug/metabolite transporter (DMT)-like permease